MHAYMRARFVNIFKEKEIFFSLNQFGEWESAAVVDSFPLCILFSKI
jgi:hypothetical protein